MGAAADGFGIVLYGSLTVHQPAAVSPSKSLSRRASRRTDATASPRLSPSSSVNRSAQRSLSNPDKASRLSYYTAPPEHGWQDNGPEEQLPLTGNAERTKSKRVSRKGAVLSRESSLGSPRTPRVLPPPRSRVLFARLPLLAPATVLERRLMACGTAPRCGTTGVRASLIAQVPLGESAAQGQGGERVPTTATRGRAGPTSRYRPGRAAYPARW